MNTLATFCTFHSSGVASFRTAPTTISKFAASNPCTQCAAVKIERLSTIAPEQKCSFVGLLRPMLPRCQAIYSGLLWIALALKITPTSSPARCVEFGHAILIQMPALIIIYAVYCGFGFAIDWISSWRNDRMVGIHQFFGFWCGTTNTPPDLAVQMPFAPANFRQSCFAPTVNEIILILLPITCWWPLLPMKIFEDIILALKYSFMWRCYERNSTVFYQSQWNRQYFMN